MSHPLLILLPILVLTFAGCGKKPTTPAGDPALATGAAQTNMAAPSNQPLDGQADPFLTQQLRIFMQQQGRFPADFAELARTRLDSRPRTPRGMKWAIDTATQEVKLVKE